jgi:hypothetical protein
MTKNWWLWGMLLLATACGSDNSDTSSGGTGGTGGTGADGSGGAGTGGSAGSASGGVAGGTSCGDTSSDPSNCGACGRSCLGGTCSAGKCGVKVLAENISHASGLAVTETNAYYGADDTVASLSFATAEVSNLATTDGSVHDVSFDADYVYWIDMASLALYRVATSGGAAQDLNPSGAPFNSPWAGVVAGDGYFFTQNGSPGAIRRVPTTGGNMEIFANGQHESADIAADAERVYWVTGMTISPATVMSAPIGGGAPEQLAATDGNPLRIALNSTHVFWIEWASGTTGNLNRVSKAGGATELIASGLANPSGLAANDQYAYVAEQNGVYVADGRLSRIEISTKNIEVLAEGQHGPKAVQLTSKAVVWLNGGTTASDFSDGSLSILVVD